MSETDTRVDTEGWVRVRIDTEPDANGWCFCTPANHPDDVARLGVTEWADRYQFFGQVAPKPIQPLKGE